MAKFFPLEQKMLLSVIIPTRNRSNYLSALIDSLFLQEAGSFIWEIIVVDNASTDNTRDVAQEKIRHAPIPIRYVYELKPGLHQGRHRGTREAAGELIAFLDDDAVLTPEWIFGIDLIFLKKLMRLSVVFFRNGKSPLLVG